MAARAGQVEVVRCLLRNGALVDARARVGVYVCVCVRSHLPCYCTTSQGQGEF